MQLPARGRQSGSSCAVVRRIARRINAGSYRTPSWAWVTYPAYGPPFLVRDRSRAWACDVQNGGLSGPSYAVRCTSDSRSARVEDWLDGDSERPEAQRRGGRALSAAILRNAS